MLAVIADLHGNSVALEAVLRDLETLSVAGLVCLGDVASFEPQPRETLRRVQALGCPVVMGNADDEILNPYKLKGLEGTRIDSSVLFDIVSWCAAQLTEQDRAFLKTFRPTVRLEFKGLPILCFHGSPASYDDVIVATTPDETLAELFQERAAAARRAHARAAPQALSGDHLRQPRQRRLALHAPARRHRAQYPLGRVRPTFCRGNRASLFAACTTT